MLIWLDSTIADNEIKTFYLRELIKKIPDCVFLNLDNIIPVFEESWLHSDRSYSINDAVIQPGYHALLQIALDNIQLGNKVILDSGAINNDQKEDFLATFSNFPELREQLFRVSLLPGKNPVSLNVNEKNYIAIHTERDCVLNINDIMSFLNLPIEEIEEKKETNAGTLIMTAGLAGSGKTTHIRTVCTRIGAVFLDKDSIADKYIASTNEYLGSKYYGHYIGAQSYDALFRIADDNLEHKKKCILDGCFGDKLTGNFIQSRLNLPAYKTVMIYFHCSGQKQHERIIKRNSPRDSEKLKNIREDRRINIQKHLSAFSQAVQPDGFLFIDTENDEDYKKNVGEIFRFITSPTLIPIRTPDRTIPCHPSSFEITTEEAQGGLDTFKQLLDRTIRRDQTYQQETLSTLQNRIPSPPRLSDARNSVWSEMNRQTEIILEKTDAISNDSAIKKQSPS